MPIGDSALMYWGLVVIAVSVVALAGLSFLPPHPAITAAMRLGIASALVGYGLELVYLWEAIAIVFDDPSASSSLRRDSAVTTALCMAVYVALAAATVRYFSPNRRHQHPTTTSESGTEMPPTADAGNPTYRR